MGGQERTRFRLDSLLELQLEVLSKLDIFYDKLLNPRPQGLDLVFMSARFSAFQRSTLRGNQMPGRKKPTESWWIRVPGCARRKQLARA